MPEGDGGVKGGAGKADASDAPLAARGGPRRGAGVTSELPGAAQRLRSPGTPGRSPHHGERRVQVGVPPRMDHDRTGAGPRSEHARDFDAPERHGARGAALGARLSAFAEEWTVGHSDARQVEDGAEMQGESGAARVVAPVDGWDPDVAAGDLAAAGASVVARV